MILVLESSVMLSSLTGVAQQERVEDALAYLPCSTVVEYKKGEMIYGHGSVCDTLYLVLSGCVKVTRLADHGGQLLFELYKTDEFFGESGLLNLSNPSEQAMAHQRSTLMGWPATDVELIMRKQPRLAIALLQFFGLRSLVLAQRMESLFFDPIDCRLARALLRFGDRLGTEQTGGSVLMEPLTHELLAQYVGTSREVVTCHMANLRRLGYVKYSRKAIELDKPGLRTWLDRRSGMRETATSSGSDAG
jgi:CRP/FNR family transcriptional regulator